MPAPAGTKRVRGVSIFRPFIFGSEAQPFDPNKRPTGIPEDHTHQWRIFVKGVNDEDISYWLKKVQFKLHETYAQSIRTIEGPPFEVTETGWGEFEIQIKLYFIPESTEKPQTLWHGLKLHPYGPDAEAQKARRDNIISQHYEEVVFNEPVEQFYNLLTGGTLAPLPSKGKAGKGSKQQQQQSGRTAEIPYSDSPRNPYSQKSEAKELDKVGEATKTVDRMLKEERAKLIEREVYLGKLKESEGLPVVQKKK
ncbi:NuA4 histone H4 acetyltransferase complex and the SWR1 complex subunit [Ophidiomyces ophidiicola]|nr:NuA4 histone H4 acetyltransferase complex and the SWR1 complex subunit [Ophidiomyces ophidiicola]KAI1941294.1 NuA4 histone H4 acetyltransferase complex and the SWR1 complex subunit [Ophidiomyces ophidiicola]KAI1961059.1 NuA4 histone H4 acetyltransferase complex and the SWR1 complex subunit [Ophidiomyces ophidiicola]